MAACLTVNEMKGRNIRLTDVLGANIEYTPMIENTAPLAPRISVSGRPTTTFGRRGGEW